MPHEPLSDPRLAIFDLLEHAVWITDPDELRIAWANLAAVALWRADDRTELCNRDLNPSPTIRALVAQLRDRVAAGERVRQERTIYPKGIPRRIEMVIGAFPLLDGRTGLLIEGRPILDVVDPEVVRAAEAVRYAPIVVMTHTLEGTLIQANTLARDVFGNTIPFNDIFADAQVVATARACIANGQVFAGDAEIATQAGPRWYSIEVRKIADPLTGLPASLVIGHDITARVQAERAKDDLVSVVSHELRTPLTAIQGAVELLRGGIADTPQVVEELFEMASENVLRLRRLVDDLLDVRRLEVGGISLEMGAVDLGGLIEGAVRMHLAVAAAKHVELDIRVREPLQVVVDAGRIQQVIWNLVSNAIKHSPSEETVVIRAERRGEKIRVEVEDRGPGVPESFRSKLFHRFSQADVSSRRGVGGTGLGLYIAKTLVELHGGELGLEGDEGKGAVFYFELPAP